MKVYIFMIYKILLKIFFYIKLYCILFFFLITSSVNAELLKPSPLLKPDQIIAIQLSALNNNDNPYKNFGIKQTWEFAHPQNRKFTGPLENFTKMMFSSSYVKMINHNKHNINLIQISNNIAFYFIEIIDKDSTRLGFNWTVEKVLVKGEFYNCWMTVSVSPPMKYGEST